MCKNKDDQPTQQAQTVDNQQQQEEQLFVVSCFTANGCSESWLIDSGCTNHMCPNEAWFKKLDRTYNSRVRIDNGDFLEVKGK